MNDATNTSYGSLDLHGGRRVTKQQFARTVKVMGNFPDHRKPQSQRAKASTSKAQATLIVIGCGLFLFGLSASIAYVILVLRGIL